MLALMDADYKFIWADVGHYGSNLNSQLFLDCDLQQHLEAGILGIPPAEALVGDTTPDRKDVPYFIVDDDAFPLPNCLMKLYSRRDLSQSEHFFACQASGGEHVWDTGQLLALSFVMLHANPPPP